MITTTPTVETLEDFIVAAFAEHDLEPDRGVYYADAERDSCHACAVGAAIVAVFGRDGAGPRYTADKHASLEAATGIPFGVWDGLDDGFSDAIYGLGDASDECTTGCAIGQRIAARVFAEAVPA